MCRLFAIRSLHPECLKNSFLGANNSLAVQSNAHKDGWGIAYYNHGLPHVYKGLKRAGEDEDFARLSKTLHSQTLIAHLRRRTQGEISLLNTHPFHYARWVMAHNGDFPQFSTLRSQLIKEVDSQFLLHLFGTTDSEVYFALFLTELKKLSGIDDPKISVKICAIALRNVVERVLFFYQRINADKELALNVVISNGALLLGYRQGHELAFCAQKSDSTPGKEGDRIERLIICSESDQGEHSFEPLVEGQIIALDQEFRLYRSL